MKKYFAAMLAIGLLMSVTVQANAITTGKWDFSGIHESIQRIAEETEPDVPENADPYPISDFLLEAIYAAVRAQRTEAARFWKGMTK